MKEYFESSESSIKVKKEADDIADEDGTKEKKMEVKRTFQGV